MLKILVNCGKKEGITCGLLHRKYFHIYSFQDVEKCQDWVYRYRQTCRGGGSMGKGVILEETPELKQDQ